MCIRDSHTAVAVFPAVVHPAFPGIFIRQHFPVLINPAKEHAAFLIKCISCLLYTSKKTGGTSKTAWDTVLLSRKSDRPVAADYINAIFDEFIEFHGDRYFGDDGAIVGGIAMFHGMPVTVIGQQKGKNTKDNLKRNFGMPSPDGYRKALRLMKRCV